MTVSALEINCPDCVRRGKESKLANVLEVWNPFPGEEPEKEITYNQCSNCGYRIILSDYMFGKAPGTIEHVNPPHLDSGEAALRTTSFALSYS